MDPLRQTTVISVEDSSQIAVARRAAAAAARQTGLDEHRCNEVEIATVELATNLLGHAGRGQIMLNAFTDANVLEILSIDNGAGMASLTECLTDGFSTNSTPGLGLGAVQRLATTMDVWSWPDRGSVFSARFAATDASATEPQQIATREAVRSLPGILCTAMHGEDASGDRWAMAHRGGRHLYLMVDGLGHGLFASEAAEMAVDIFLNAVSSSPTELLEQMHGPMRSTRGAAAAIVAVDAERRTLIFCGAGNITASLHTPTGHLRTMVSHNGIVGHQMRRVQAFEYPYQAGDLLILHSDGITTHWKIEDYPGLQQAAPSAIASILYRDFNRGRDDATVLVTRL